jgi:hypothetical protein
MRHETYTKPAKVIQLVKAGGMPTLFETAAILSTTNMLANTIVMYNASCQNIVCLIATTLIGWV